MQVSILSVMVFVAGNFPKEIYNFILRDRITRTKYDRKPKLAKSSNTIVAQVARKGFSVLPRNYSESRVIISSKVKYRGWRHIRVKKCQARLIFDRFDFALSRKIIPRQSENFSGLR